MSQKEFLQTKEAVGTHVWHIESGFGVVIEMETEKRKANLGEKILIQRPLYTPYTAKHGDIFKVEKLHADGSGAVRVSIDSPLGFSWMYPCEYEVIVGEETDQ